MSDAAFKDGRYPIELGGKQYHMCFTLNVMADVTERFGGLDKLGDAFGEGNPSRLQNVRWLLTSLLNEGGDEGDPELQERQVGRMITAANLKAVMAAILASMGRGINGDEPAEDDESGEAQAGK